MSSLEFSQYWAMELRTKLDVDTDRTVQQSLTNPWFQMLVFNKAASCGHGFLYDKPLLQNQTLQINV